MNKLGVSNVSFGRALTTEERRQWEKFQQSSELKKELGLRYNENMETIAVVPSFSVPSKKNDIGIGTSYSEDAQKMLGFFHSLMGINALQDLPEGEVSNANHSPYDSTNFSLGAHKVDLSKLTTPAYGSLLTDSDLDYIVYEDGVDALDKTKVQYDNVLEIGGNRDVLHVAFERFQKLPENSPLKAEFQTFKKDNAFWLNKDALYEAEVIKNNGERDFTKWSYADQNVFATRDGNHALISQLESNYSQEIEEAKFVQFIADKQRQEAKDKYNAQGIGVYGDIPIGFSHKDIWTHKNAFYPDFANNKFGVQGDDGQYNSWSPAVDFRKIDGPAGDLLRDKYKLAFMRYDGVRVDAAWQLLSPVVVNGHNQPVYNQYIGDKILNGIIMDEADKAGVPRDKIYLELLGGKSWDCLDDAKKTGANLIHISRYANDGWGRVKYYEAQTGPNNRYQNMRSGQYIIGAGTHDDNPAVEQALDGENRAHLFARDLRMDENKLRRSPAERLKAIFAELFTTKKQFVSLPDMLGEKRRINTPNTVGNHNWTYRADDYERTYYKNLTCGKGLNLADAYSKAIKAKNGGRETAITRQLDYWAQKLSMDTNCYTEQEANEKYGADFAGMA